MTWFNTSGKWWPLLGQIGTWNSKTVVGIAATAKLWIQDIDYDQYWPDVPFKYKLALIHVLLQSLWLDSSPVANVGLWVLTQEQATAKQWWALQQPPSCEFKTWIVINIDQMHHSKISWHSYMCFFSHFDLIPHRWQLMASGSNRNKQQQNSGGHCSNCQLVVNSGHRLCSIQTSYTI
jgi:hypothetical protein